MHFNILQFLTFFPIVLFSITIHEAAHALAAYKMGDPTANYMGRLTLNPLKHIDPIGTILVPILLHMSGLPPFGWAKPVPVDFRRLRDQKLGYIAVGISGPLANFAFAIIAGLFIRILPVTVLSEFLTILFVLNMILGMFNMIPFPPLDGSRVLYAFLSYKNRILFHQFERYSFIVLIVLILTNSLDFIFFNIFLPLLKLTYYLLTGYILAF